MLSTGATFAQNLVACVVIAYVVFTFLFGYGSLRARRSAAGNATGAAVPDGRLDSVAGRLEVNFDLRPAADVFGAGRSRSVLLPRSQTIVTFFGPDVDTSRSASFEAVRSSRSALETSLSGVIEPSQMMGLPFGGRDLYTMLLTQPGVSADAATSRGLGLSANGWVGLFFAEIVRLAPPERPPWWPLADALLASVLEAGYRPDVITGISVGALNGGFLASRAGRAIRAGAGRIDWRSVGWDLVDFWRDRVTGPQAIVERR